MNKKSIIQLVVIVACFAASGIVIYNNFFKKTVMPVPPMNSAVAVKIDAPILPNGSSFDLKPLQDSKLKFKLINYPLLSYPVEVGSEPDKILKPLHSQTGIFSTTPPKK